MHNADSSFCFSYLDISANALSTSSHIWLLCTTLVLTLLEGQRWPFFFVISEERVQTHRLWAIPSASNHQRFMHTESIRVPRRTTDHWGEGRVDFMKDETKSNKENLLIFIWRDLFYVKRSWLQDSGFYEHKKEEFTRVEGNQFVKHKNHFVNMWKTFWIAAKRRLLAF